MASERVDVLAEAAFLAFCREHGRPPEEWDAVPNRQRKAWRSAALAVVRLYEDLATDSPSTTDAKSEG